MKANKKGISLIVLIITIVVIIILAAAIILNLSNTNVVNNANKAVASSDLDTVKSAVTIKYADIYAIKQDNPTVTEVVTGGSITKPDGTTTTITGVNADLGTSIVVSDTVPTSGTGVTYVVTSSFGVDKYVGTTKAN